MTRFNFVFHLFATKQMRAQSIYIFEKMCIENCHLPFVSWTISKLKSVKLVRHNFRFRIKRSNKNKNKKNTKRKKQRQCENLLNTVEDYFCDFLVSTHILAYTNMQSIFLFLFSQTSSLSVHKSDVCNDGDFACVCVCVCVIYVYIFDISYWDVEHTQSTLYVRMIGRCRRIISPSIFRSKTHFHPLFFAAKNRSKSHLKHIQFTYAVASIFIE